MSTIKTKLHQIWSLIINANLGISDNVWKLVPACLIKLDSDIESQLAIIFRHTNQPSSKFNYYVDKMRLSVEFIPISNKGYLRCLIPSHWIEKPTIFVGPL